jgi:hypothetical protein
MPIECDLIEHAAFEQGVVMHRYKLRDDHGGMMSKYGAPPPPTSPF